MSSKVDLWQGKDRRNDVDTAQTFTYAVGINSVLGLYDAILFLRSFELNKDTVERVLLGSNRRGIKEAKRDTKGGRI